MKKREAELFIEELNTLVHKYNFAMQHYDELYIVDNAEPHPSHYIELRYNDNNDIFEAHYVNFPEDKKEDN